MFMWNLSLAAKLETGSKCSCAPIDICNMQQRSYEAQQEMLQCTDTADKLAVQTDRDSL